MGRDTLAPEQHVTIADADLERLLVAVLLLLVFAHGLAHLFGKLRQPP